MAADRLEDPDYPGYTTGRAAEALGVQQVFLRALDTAGARRGPRPGGASLQAVLPGCVPQAALALGRATARAGAEPGRCAPARAAGQNG